jgi:hypothetical protein
MMVEPDIRLFESHHFNDQDGQMAISAEELKYPSTAFGELRRLAIVEHGRKKRAAQFISLWYGRHLVRKGFIQDEKRRRELFSARGVTEQNQSILDLARSAAEEHFETAKEVSRTTFGRLFGWLVVPHRTRNNGNKKSRRYQQQHPQQQAVTEQNSPTASR